MKVESIDSIRIFVDRLIRRERTLIGLEVLGRLALVVALAGVASVVLAWMDVHRGWAATLLTSILGVGVWAAAVVPVFTRWRPAGDRMRQARLVEAAETSLRGRLVTVVERLDAPPGAESPVLLARIAKKAFEGSQKVAPPSIHGAERAAVFAGIGALAMLAPLPLSLIAGGPLQVVGWWATRLDASDAAVAATEAAEGARAQVGDLVLRYVYPPYTGLEPRSVENSTGDAAGPPGTVVTLTARSARPLDAAGLVAYDQRFEARLEDDRTIEGSLTLEAGEGTYHLLTWSGGESARSRDFKLMGEADLAPEVMLESERDVLELAADEPFRLGWRARDDFGVASVAVHIEGKRVGKPFFKAQGRKAEVFGDLQRTPEELGLKEGDRVRLELAATDNDTVSGAKVGVSRAVELVVLGSRGVDARAEAALNDLVVAMVGVLADHLEEPFPVGTTVGELADWAPVVAERYESLKEVVDREWPRMREGGLERTVLEKALEAGGEVVRFAAITFESGSEQAVAVTDLAELGELRKGAIVALEDAILAMDRMLRMRALREAVEVTERMESIGEELEELLAQENPDSLELLAKLEQLQAMLKELSEAAAKLDDGGLKEFLNARENETRSLMEEVRKAIQAGEMEEARELMQRLARQLQQTAEGVRDTLERQKGEGDQTMEQAQALQEELEQLEQEQRALQEEVQKLQEEEGQDAADEVARLWEEIAAEAMALHGSLEAYEAGLTAAERGFSELQRTGHALLQSRQLRAAAQLRDYRGARGGQTAVSYAVESMVRGLKTARMMSRDLRGPADAELRAMQASLERIAELLDQLDRDEASPEMTARSQELQERQQELQERLEQATQKAEQLAEEFPVRPGEMQERLEEADKRMQEADDDLGQGKPMPAQGSQGAAADRIREAREELESAMEQAQQQQEQLEPSQGQQEQERRDGEDGRGQRDDPPDVEIPGAEEFRTPEEYRRALLEGMEGEVPEEFRALKKRYFEELVAQ